MVTYTDLHLKFNPKKKRGIRGISEYTEEKNIRIYGNNRKIFIKKISVYSEIPRIPCFSPVKFYVTFRLFSFGNRHGAGVASVLTQYDCRISDFIRRTSPSN